MKTRRFEMKKRTFAIITLSLLSLAFLAYLANAQPAERERGPRPDIREGFRDMLNLTPEQEAKLEKLREARAKEREAFWEQMNKMQEDLKALRDDPKADPKKVEDLIDELSRMRAEEAKAMFRDRKEFEQVLTPEQLEKLSKIRDWRGERRLEPGRRIMPRPGRMFLRGRFFGHGPFSISPFRGFGHWRFGRPGFFWHRMPWGW
jgi:Spy/CpxP family protein refolding chaperone